LVYTKYIVSRRLLDMLSLFIEKIYNKNYNISLLEKINSFINIDFNYNVLIKRFNARYKIYKIWFKIIKPKIIFLNCYYDKQYVIKVAKELNIKTIDIQHGLIGKKHSAYYADIKLNKDYLPDYLFAFGKYDKENISKGNIFNKKHIFEVGNYYLEYLRKNFIRDEKLLNIIKKYNISVGVSLQWTVENEMINFINSVANKQKDTLFILIPREYKDEYNNLNLEDNVIFYPKLDCYQVIMHCHYHCTVYSTCAIEVPSLGIPNIMVNIDGLTNKYMENLFDKDITYLVDTQDEFIHILQTTYTFKVNEVIQSNERYFTKKYKKNIENAVKKIMKDN